MEQSTAASPWLLLLCLAVAATGGALQARAQPDVNGFISIDCGLAGKTRSYVDDTTKLLYTSDTDFIGNVGSTHNISAQYMVRPTHLSRRYHSVRSFPDGVRNCYTLRSLVPGGKYLLRASFMYGDYDGLGSLPIFDLHVGVNYWQTVNISEPDLEVTAEAVVFVPDEFVHVCLLNTGAGTPFISDLELRPLKKKFYPQANLTKGLVLEHRLNLAPPDTSIVRYPVDPHDRVWLPKSDAKMWSSISTTETVQSDGDVFEVPSMVMQTAVTPLNAAMNLEIIWSPNPQPQNQSLGYLIIMHFSELQLLPSNAERQFYISINDMQLPEPVSPHYLGTGFVSNGNARYRDNKYNISMYATANSTLPPVISAVEFFSVISATNIATDSQDVSAIMAIKANYEVQKNWMGDPCVPKTMVWERLTCSYTSDNSPRIISINLSSSGLNGDISSSFTNFKAVQYLDLSNNNLTGSIPGALSQLTSLTILDLSGNHLNGSISPELLKRTQDGSLNLRHGNNPDICTDGNSCQPTKTKNKLAIYGVVLIAVIVVLVLVAVALFFFLRQRNPESMNNSVKSHKEMKNDGHRTEKDGYGNSPLGLETRQFTYIELERITNNFRRVLGKGGFGNVYEGSLEDGTQVAVKIRSKSSNQGDKEFLTEVQILTLIHHKNLVSMIGYCKDGEHMALVYEFMSEGTLEEHISGKGNNAVCLPWRQRLRIAVESAQGLEYLHKGCNPPLVHRDVKATNILLNAKLEAKIADFGLSKAFHHNDDTHVSTNRIVGTPGYVDPDYQTTWRATSKSDVYSFGIVLLVLVTGKPPILRTPHTISIIEWVQQRLAQGNIEGVVDVRIHGDHDINSMWKAAVIALKCTTEALAERPTMTDVVAQLQECLNLEEELADGGSDSGIYNGTNSDDINWTDDAYSTNKSTNSSQRAALEKEHNFGRVPTMDTGPAVR
ncbi:probable LRR receptor-like serine/threonine-protein kinase At1g05700 [Triticum urartu]|nr:probable LRR receptor-like serine/threonine-protein kinase At1g05700 [Triticum urartu]